MSILDSIDEGIWGVPAVKVEKKVETVSVELGRVRCPSRDEHGNQCGFEKGHELKPYDPDNVNHPRHGWAGRTPMIRSWV